MTLTTITFSKNDSEAALVCGFYIERGKSEQWIVERAWASMNSGQTGGTKAIQMSPPDSPAASVNYENSAPALSGSTAQGVLDALKHLYEIGG